MPRSHRATRSWRANDADGSMAATRNRGERTPACWQGAPQIEGQISRLKTAARGTAKSGQPHRHLPEERRYSVFAIIFHPTNLIAAGANRPPDRVLPRLRGGDLALNPREQLLRFREGQSQIGDIAEIIRLADLHDVHARTLTPGCRQPQNPLDAPPPVREQGRNLPGSRRHPHFCTSPSRKLCSLPVADTRPSILPHQRRLVLL
jgi:hypothetical protein